MRREFFEIFVEVFLLFTTGLGIGFILGQLISIC